MGYIRNRGTPTSPNYQIRVWANGTRVEIPARTPDGVRCRTSDQARAALRAFEDAAIDGSLDTRRERLPALTVSALCDRFVDEYRGTRVRTPATYRRDNGTLLAHVREAFGAHLASTVGPEMVARLRRTLEAKGFAPVTVRHVLIRLRSMYRWAVRQRLVRRDPTAGMDLPSVDAPNTPLDPERYYTAAEVETILGYTAAREPDWHAYVALLATTGIRPPSEPARMTWLDVDLVAGTVLIRRSKGGPTTTVHLHALALDALRTWRARSWHTPTSRVFARPMPARRSKPAGARVPDASYVLRQVQRIYAAAGVRVLDQYALRHTALTLAASGGAGLADLAALAGHRSLQTTRRYLHEQDRRADAAIAAIRITPRVPEERGAPGATPTKPSSPRKVGRRKQRGSGPPRERG